MKLRATEMCGDQWHSVQVAPRGFAALAESRFDFPFLPDDDQWSPERTGDCQLLIVVKSNHRNVKNDCAWFSYKEILLLSPGDLVLLAGFFEMTMAAMMQLNAMLPLITRGFDGLRRIDEVLDCSDIEDSRGKQSVARVRVQFVFESVSFAHDKELGAGGEQLSGGRTTFIITHRQVDLSGVKRVVSFDRGIPSEFRSQSVPQLVTA